MNALATMTQNRKATLDIDIPLHADTDCEQDVAELVRRLLNDISELDRQASHADVLQALAIATAVRTAMADAAANPSTDFSLELLGVEVGSDCGVETYAN